MAPTIPTLQQIIQRVRADFRVEAGIDVLRRSIESGLLRVQAYQSKAQYAYLKYLNDQAFPDTADEEHFWRHAANRGLEQKDAQSATGVVRFTGVDTTVVPLGQSVSRSDGLTYVTTETGAIGDDVTGQLDLAVEAEQVGSDSNNDDGAALTLSTSIVGVDSACTWESTTIDGTDDETQADGYARYLQDVRNPASGGGASGDYVRWALEVPGVTRAWEYAIGNNEVAVAFVRDNDGSGAAILPDSGERDEVQTYVQAKAPITVTISIRVLTALTVNVTLGALTPNTSAVQDAVEAELVDLFGREAEPGATIELSQIDAAISEAAGETSHIMTVPAAAVSPTITQIPILGSISFP